MIWLAFGLGLLVSAFGATAGAALVAVGRTELTRSVSRRLRGVTEPLAVLSRVEYLLTAASATTALGVLILGASLPALFAGTGFVASALALVLVAVPGVLVTGYLVPRWLTQPRAGAVAEWVMPVLRPWARVLGLLLPARSAFHASDFRSIWREGAAVGLEADDQLAIIGGVMTFAHRPVREVMTPRTDIVAVSEDASLRDITLAFAQSGYSRMPVYRGTLDNIIGMLHAFDLFKLHPGDPLPVRPVTAAPATRSCGDLLLDMQQERRHLAVLLDEFGGTLGIATLEDLLEELVGEIFDEKVQGAPTREPEVFEADGASPPAAIEDRFNVKLPTLGVATIGGLLASLVGRIPNAGERFLLSGLEFDVVDASPSRIERLQIRPGPVSAVALPERGS